jgi:hypothetical protein
LLVGVLWYFIFISVVTIGVCCDKGGTSPSHALSCEISRTESQVTVDYHLNLMSRVNAVLPGLLLSECNFIRCRVDIQGERNMEMR